MSTSTASVFNQLRSYCYGLEQDSKMLRSRAEGATAANDEGDAEAAAVFAGELTCATEHIQARASALQEQFFGQGSRVPAHDVVERCKSLCQLNEVTMSLLEAHMRRFGSDAVAVAATSTTTGSACVGTGTGTGTADVLPSKGMSVRASAAATADVENVNTNAYTHSNTDGQHQQQMDEDDDDKVKVISVNDFVSSSPVPTHVYTDQYSSVTATARTGTGAGAGTAFVASVSPLAVTAADGDDTPTSAGGSNSSNAATPAMPDGLSSHGHGHGGSPGGTTGSDDEKTPCMGDFAFSRATSKLVCTDGAAAVADAAAGMSLGADLMGCENAEIVTDTGTHMDQDDSTSTSPARVVRFCDSAPAAAIVSTTPIALASPGVCADASAPPAAATPPMPAALSLCGTITPDEPSATPFDHYHDTSTQSTPDTPDAITPMLTTALRRSTFSAARGRNLAADVMASPSPSPRPVPACKPHTAPASAPATPSTHAAAITSVGAVHYCSSPMTPPAIGTSTTTRYGHSNCNSNVTDASSMGSPVTPSGLAAPVRSSSAAAAAGSGSGSGSGCPVTPTAPSPIPSASEDGASDSDSDTDDAHMPTASPLRMGTLLQPRVRNAAASEGWIPAVGDDEYGACPSFLKMQNSMVVLNCIIDALNVYIATHQGSGRLETFTDEEITKMAPSVKNIKIVCLGLVQLKRLDLGQENGVKVYKVRRFY